MNTPIPTPSGWTTMGALHVGDALFDENGQICRVIAVHPINSAPASYRLTFDDGVQMDACAEHEWLTFNARELAALTRLDHEWRTRRRAGRKSRAGTGTKKSARFTASLTARNAAKRYEYKPAPGGTVRTTAEIATTLRTTSGRANHAIPVCKPLSLPDANLPVDPYVLGAWLGDGTGVNGSITCFDPEILDHIRRAGFAISARAKAGSFNVTGLHTRLRALGVSGDKHIPQVYLRASAPQRLSLLQGLMDTDGWATPSGAGEFTTTRSALRDGFRELLASLGIKGDGFEGRAKLNGRDCGPKYRFKFTTDLPVFRLTRKLSRQNRTPRRTTKFRYVVACEAIAPVPMRCITVDSPSHLYLAGCSMVPTHNSYAVLLEPLRHVTTNPAFSCVMFRRTTVQVRNPGGLWDESVRLYGLIPGAKPVQNVLEWHFTGGGKIKFAHLEHENNVLDWQGAQVPLLIFDELVHFSSAQFWYLLSRNRSMCGVRPYVRATCNPDADSWVAELIAWWINQETGQPIPERAGVLRWFVRVGEAIVWADRPEELAGYTMLNEHGEQVPIPPKSLTFIPSKLTDNPALMKADPGYLANLLALPLVERERLLGGNWLIRPSAGLLFQRGWCTVVDAVPAGLRIVRGWDLAGTPEAPGTDPDWTCGTKIGTDGRGIFYVLDHVRMRGSPGQVQSFVLNTASADGTGTAVALAQDPAQAGKFQAQSYIASLAGYDARASIEGGKKEVRFGPFSAQAEAGNVRVLRGGWNKDWFTQLEAFPSAAHDDDADSTSTAFKRLAQPEPTPARRANIPFMAR